MILFNAVELAELLQLGHQRVDHIEAFKQFRAALLVATVLLLFYRFLLVLQVRDLVAQSTQVSLLGAQFHDFLSELVQ